MQVHTDSNLVSGKSTLSMNMLRDGVIRDVAKLRDGITPIGMRVTSRFIDVQPYTSPELISEINEQISKILSKSRSKLSNGARIGVMFTIEWALDLLNRGCTDVTLITQEYDELMDKLSYFGYKYKTLDEVINNDMKFDVIVGNPPFSLAGGKSGKKGRAKNLYPEFYEKSVNMAKYVAMIVPDTHRQNISFNSFVRAHTNKIMPVKIGTFNVNISTWCLFKDGSETNLDHIDWADLQTIPEQKVVWAKGKINVTTEKHLLEDKGGKFTVYHKINGKGLHKTTTSDNVSDKKLFPATGYAVIMPQQIQQSGWTKTAIVKCNGLQAATNGVNIAFVQTKKEAEYLVEYMKSRSFIDQALANCGGMNNMTLGAMQKINMTDYAF